MRCPYCDDASTHVLETRELDAGRIGELALLGLRGLGAVAYVRFASVYRDFDDVSQFEAELARLEASGGTGSVRAEADDLELPPNGASKMCKAPQTTEHR